MNVVFFATGREHMRYAHVAASAVRLFHPDWATWVLTDRDTKVDEDMLRPVRGFTSPATLMYDRTVMELHFLREHSNETLFLDSDCLVNRPLDNFMQGPIGLTQRIPPKQVEGMVYNCGVKYASGKLAQAFWSHWVDTFAFIQRDAWAWYGDQVILPELAKEYPGWVSVYECDTHNYSWSAYAELESHMSPYVVHFKGDKRKPHMRPYFERLKRWVHEPKQPKQPQEPMTFRAGMH